MKTHDSIGELALLRLSRSEEREDAQREREEPHRAEEKERDLLVHQLGLAHELTIKKIGCSFRTIFCWSGLC